MARSPCPRRRRLYDQQLAETKTYLEDLAGEYPRLATALRDTRLVDALAEILDNYVVYGVERDFVRLSGDATRLPGTGVPDPFPAALTSEPMGARQHYQRYFDLYIDAPLPSGKTGVTAFYDRYPLLAHAVQLAAKHHQENIDLACARVSRDWQDIERAFFPGATIERLTKIRTTGNDFHKDGKQVLILTFLLDTGTSGRVVYKPSAVEIDCRIVGDSDIVNAIAPQGYHQDASLTEIVNRYSPARARPERFTSRALPTYRILPYNRDSVPDAYGYIEFLRHEPALDMEFAQPEDIPEPTGDAVGNVAANDIRRSDWIVTDETDGLVFNHQLGGLMAMAMSVSLCDLHIQNVITHDRQPHLIDLEEALKRPMKTVSDTYLTGVLNRFDEPDSAELVIDRDRTTQLQAKWGVVTFRSAPAAVYLYRGAGVRAKALTVAGPDGDPLRRALIRGFVDVVDALAGAECNDAVKAWVKGLDGTIARFVPVATATLAARGRRLYQRCCEYSIDMLATDADYDRLQPRDRPAGTSFFGAVVTDQRREWSDRRANTAAGTPERAWSHPSFAVEHPMHAWRDYLNCDVPSFYHRLGSTDLLNSSGDRVDVGAVRQWQDRYINGVLALPGDWQANAGGEYFPEAPTAMVVRQLDDLKARCATIRDKRAYLQEALRSAALLGTGDVLVKSIREAHLRSVAGDRLEKVV